MLCLLFRVYFKFTDNIKLTINEKITIIEMSNAVNGLTFAERRMKYRILQKKAKELEEEREELED